MNGFDITSGFLFLRRTPSKAFFTLPTCLRALLDLEFLSCGQAGAVDGVGGGYFGDCVCVQVVGSKRQIFSERNFELVWNTGVVASLDQKIIDDSLIADFKSHQYILTDKASVRVESPGAKWTILDSPPLPRFTPLE